MLTHFLGKGPPDLWAHSPAAQRDIELARERASSLGRFGRDLEAALHALADFDAAHPRRHPLSPQDLKARSALIVEAGRVLWHFIIQREACGLYHSGTVMNDYRVPAEVQHEMGAMHDSRPRATR